MMEFHSLNLVPTGTVLATAKGHPTDIVKTFREVCDLLLGDIGPWRMTKIHGTCSDEKDHDSDMTWDLEAKVKTLPQSRGWAT